MKLPDFIDKGKVLTGVAASPGILIGKAYLVDRSKVKVIYQYLIDESFIEKDPGYTPPDSRRQHDL